MFLRAIPFEIPAGAIKYAGGSFPRKKICRGVVTRKKRRGDGFQRKYPGGCQKEYTWGGLKMKM